MMPAVKSKHTALLNDADIAQAIQELYNSITASHPNFEHLCLIAVGASSYPVARRLKTLIHKNNGADIHIGKLDITIYRDDLLERNQFVTVGETNIAFDIQNKIIVLIDAVLFHGRTVGAALSALSDIGRPQKIELAALIDRGHRELPIFAQHIGKTIQTDPSDKIELKLLEIEGEDIVYLR